MTFFGAFLRRIGGWIAVADLVALMGDLDLDEQAVRSAVSRLKRRLEGIDLPDERIQPLQLADVRVASDFLDEGVEQHRMRSIQ